MYSHSYPAIAILMWLYHPNIAILYNTFNLNTYGRVWPSSRSRVGYGQVLEVG